nr:MAG TPA: hypothetical protein [Caudoviricetes sp.]
MPMLVRPPRRWGRGFNHSLSLGAGHKSSGK